METGIRTIRRKAIGRCHGRRGGMQKDMPKRVGHLYERAVDKDYIRSIIYRAGKHREKRPDIARVLANIDSCVDRLYSMLTKESYVPHRPKIVEIYDEASQKTRIIQMLPFFPDCIIQWIAVDLLMGPVLMRGMDHYCCSSIPGRGGHHAYRRLRGFIRRNHKNARYAVQMDIRHYYDNIDIGILMGMLRRRCKDERLLRLVELMLRSSAPDKDKGIAIGFYLNQWMANFYLENVDRLVHQGKDARCYIRHMDNITFLGRNRRRLRRKMREIADEAGGMGLSIKHDFQLFPLSARDIRAVGYRFFASGRISLRKRNWLKLRRQLLRLARTPAQRISPGKAMSFLSRLGNIRHVASFRIRERYMRGISIDAVKRRISA